MQILAAANMMADGNTSLPVETPCFGRILVSVSTTKVVWRILLNLPLSNVKQLTQGQTLAILTTHSEGAIINLPCNYLQEFSRQKPPQSLSQHINLNYSL